MSPRGLCAGKVVSEPSAVNAQGQVANDKRVAIFLNTNPTRAETAILQERCITPVVYKRSGRLATLRAVNLYQDEHQKRSSQVDTRRGGRERLQNSAWITQVCQQHTALGGPGRWRLRAHLGRQRPRGTTPTHVRTGGRRRETCKVRVAYS